MRAILLPLLALTLACTATTACAQRRISDEQRQAIEQRWQDADRDGDGAIDRAEAEAGLPRVYKNFDRLDSNGDGKLTREELKALAGQFAGRRRR